MRSSAEDASERRQITVERLIAAPPEAIFEVLADPARHPVIDGSGTVKAPTGPVARLGPGVRFGMAMRIGVPYRIQNTVVEFEEGRLLAWRHRGGQRWRYQLEPVDGATLVRETFDYRGALSPLVLELVGFPSRNRRAMQATLERLDKLVTTPVADG